MRGFRKAVGKILDKTIDLAATLRTAYECWNFVRRSYEMVNKIGRTTFAAVVRAFVTKVLAIKHK